jgi:hypothetical protein
MRQKQLATPAGDSAEQREAERFMIQKLSDELGTTLTPFKLDLENGGRLTVDGGSEQPPMLCEAWAHIGEPKPAQKAKVMMDAIKLALAGQCWIGSRPRLILAFADQAATKPFEGKSWMAQAPKDFHIEKRVVQLSPDLHAKVLAAQRRQGERGNRRSEA